MSNRRPGTVQPVIQGLEGLDQALPGVRRVLAEQTVDRLTPLGQEVLDSGRNVRRADGGERRQPAHGNQRVALSQCSHGDGIRAVA